MTHKNKLSSANAANSDEIDLSKVFRTLVDDKWFISAIISLFACVAILYTVFATPIYRADALVQVEKTPGSSLLTSMLPDSQPTSSTEIELIKSRMVIGRTIDNLNLEVDIKRKYFPFFGRGYAHIMGHDKNNLSISHFSIPEGELNQPYLVTIGDHNTFTLTKNDIALLNGKIGALAQTDEYSILIDKADALAGNEFIIAKRPFLTVYNGILKSFDVNDKGKDTGVLGLSYDNEDFNMASTVLNSIAENYLLQNVQRKTEEAEKSLSFLHEQLPIVRSKLDADEDKLNKFRQQNESVDLSLEAKSVLDTLVQLDAQLNELTFKETDISKLYTKDHPSYKALLQKQKVLEQEKAKLNKKVSQLPMTQQEILRLTRDVKVGQQVYMQMLNKQQELEIAKASTVGNVRIIDNGMTRLSSVKPQKLIVILLGIIFGAFVSVAYSLIRKAMHKGIESPEVLETMGLNVYASVPLSEWQKERDKKFQFKNSNKNVRSADLLAIGNPADLAIEAIRSLRTSLHFSMMEAKNNILMISGVSPSIGKSFISVNLAAVLAQANKKVLIIDADMRKGYLHTILATDNGDHGLSNALSGKVSFEDVVVSVPGVAGLSMVSRGKIPPNPSELLMNERLQDFVVWAKNNFDIVLIDTPPILAVTDPAIIGRMCGTALLVARFEENTAKEVDVSVRRFMQNDVEIKGVILNAVVRRYSNEGYGYYQYEYKS
jgi:tyrosine-protein kinase Etk/Wzc